ncbi:MAG: thiamine-phosphate pyrophosphorylase [Elusimicrobiota bacterium]
MQKNSHYRVIDANINRASEGLRVIEDTVRFLNGDKKIFYRARELRHGLSRVSKNIYPLLIGSRNSVGDSGGKVVDAKHRDVVAVLVANFKRAQESVRVLEEYSRLISRTAGFEFKKIRFKLYTLEKDVAKRFFGRLSD